MRASKVDLGKPIQPFHSIEGWKTLPINECGEPLVALGPFSRYPEILTSAIYAGENTDSPYPLGALEGALLTMFVRQGVADRLMKAQSFLPEGHYLLVYDAYRPLEVQKSLFNFSVQGLVNKGMAENEARAETEKYFALPSEDPAQPPPHLTGGAVDLTVVQFDEDKRQTFVELSRIIQDPSRHWMDRKISALSRQNLFLLHSRLLDMGTPFDAITPEAATAYFERQPKTATDIICRSNRRILWNAMTEAGFSFYELEWWHADFGNQCDMASTGRPAIYGPAPYSIANILHEEMRRTQHASCNYFITWGTTLHHPVAAGMP